MAALLLTAGGCLLLGLGAGLVIGAAVGRERACRHFRGLIRSATAKQP